MSQLLLFGTQYIPHGHCYLWQTPLIGLHVAADALIAIAYYSIPITLIYFVRRVEELPFKNIFILFYSGLCQLRRSTNSSYRFTKTSVSQYRWCSLYDE